jgi:hypothetical protein
MSAPEIRLFELAPRPCGQRHRKLRAIYECTVRNGVPGFDLREITPEVGR